MTNDVGEHTGDQAKATPEAASQPTEKAAQQGAPTVMGELRSIGREATLEALKALNPIAKHAAERAAQEVATRVPAMARDYGTKMVGRVTSTAVGGVTGVARKSVETATGAVGGVTGVARKGAETAAGAAGGLVSKMLPGGGDGGDGKEPKGTGKGRRLPIQEWVDVGVPVENAYAQWTQFKEFPKYMFRTERIEQKDDTHLEWHSKIWGIRRTWEAEITEQRPKERIAWKATTGPSHIGVISFHPLAHNLTRVQVNLDFQPTGLLEKTASGVRATRRAVKSDLMRFKAMMEMREEPQGAWEGTIEEGKVVKKEPEQAAQVEAGREQPTGQGPEQGKPEEQQQAAGQEPPASA
jgi:uncharacterized membrane protein